MMEVRTNRLDDIRKHYRAKLVEVFNEREADVLTFQLLTEFTGNSKVDILANPKRSISESELLKIHFGVKELLKHKPIQYVLGKSDFFGFDFIVNPKVLIPRPETEEMVDNILKKTNKKSVYRILDIGTGSGCIAITLKKYLPSSSITAIDISEFALEVARENAKLHHVEIKFKCLDFLNPEYWHKLGAYDIIAANPPYVRPVEKQEMGPEVLQYEPSTALFVAEENPLVFYRAIAKFCSSGLLRGGDLYCEINQYLSMETSAVFEKSGFSEVSVENDLFGNFRFIHCKK